MRLKPGYYYGNCSRRSQFPGSGITGTINVKVYDVDNAMNMSELNTFTIAPNPANRILHIDWGTNTLKSISIISITGSIVAEYAYENTIDISSLKNGIYMIRVRSNDQMNIRRFIKY